MGVPSEYSVGSEVDIGWQFVLDPKPKPGHASGFEVLDKEFEKDNVAASLVEEGVETESVNDEEIIFHCAMAQEMSNDSVMTEEITKKDVEGLTDQPSNCSLEPNETSRKLGNASVHGKGEVNSVMIERSAECLPASTWSLTNSPSSKASNSWRTADKEALAVLVAQKTSEKLENCDLPTPRSKCRTIMDSWEVLEENPLDASKSVDRDLFTSSFQDGDSSHLENVGLHTNTRPSTRSEPKSSSFLPATTQPLNISVGRSMPMHHRLSHSYRLSNLLIDLAMLCTSADNKSTSWSGGGGGGATGSFLNKSLNPLVEALCHSQTRAREAEQRSEQATREYKSMSHLFFREASLSLTYRHWICSLQAENAWLKMCVQNHHGAIWLQHSFPSTSVVLDQLSNGPWKLFMKENIHRQMLKHFSDVWRCKDSSIGATARNVKDDANFLLGCTIGLAFALGLTLAGAGLVLGWRMGWITFPCQGAIR
uniref:Uncharacterized protein n=1 Tax=Physcomitrium patens TaxID=3218 RepID=A0A7I4E028_PHYPA